jgi:hypothetical protein
MTNKTHISQVDERILLFEDGTAPLGAAASLVGNVIQVSGFTHITGFIYSDVTGGLVIEQGLAIADFPIGTAATSMVTSSALAITAANITDNAFSVQIVAPFVRIIYVNGAGAQTDFRAVFEARVLRGL